MIAFVTSRQIVIYLTNSFENIRHILESWRVLENWFPNENLLNLNPWETNITFRKYYPKAF